MWRTELTSTALAIPISQSFSRFFFLWNWRINNTLPFHWVLPWLFLYSSFCFLSVWYPQNTGIPLPKNTPFSMQGKKWISNLSLFAKIFLHGSSNTFFSLSSAAVGWRSFSNFFLITLQFISEPASCCLFKIYMFANCVVKFCYY